MKCFPVTFVLMVVAETMLAAVMSGMYHLTDGQEVEENLILSKRRAIAEHDHRDDSSYSGILSDEEDIESFRHLKPSEIKSRMRSILEKMDRNKNGLIEKDELSNKLMESYRKLSIEESDAEFEATDINEDNYVTWKEYVGDHYGSDNVPEEMPNEEKDIFLAADLDKDNMLNQIEFRYFYTPEDYSHMSKVLTSGVLNRFDANQDGKITFDEFIDDRRTQYNSEWIQEEKKKFIQELDVNGDGVLNEDEIYSWASPNNSRAAENEADSLISKSDKNDDGILSFDEILDNYLVFISSESEGYYIFRDEL